MPDSSAILQGAAAGLPIRHNHQNIEIGSREVSRSLRAQFENQQQLNIEIVDSHPRIAQSFDDLTKPLN